MLASIKCVPFILRKKTIYLLFKKESKYTWNNSPSSIGLDTRAYVPIKNFNSRDHIVPTNQQRTPKSTIFQNKLLL